MIRKYISIFTFLLLLTLTFTIDTLLRYDASAQEGITTATPVGVEPLPTPAPPEPVYRSPADMGYNFAFLTAEIDTPVALMMEELADAVLLSDWNAVLEYDTDNGLDALMIDASARDFVDREWLGTAYRDGLVVARIGMLPVEGAELLNSACELEEAQQVMSPEMAATYAAAAENVGLQDIIWTYRFVWAVERENQELAEEIFFDTCTDNYEDLGRVYLAHRFSTDYIVIDQLDPDIFLRVGTSLGIAIQDVYELKATNQLRESGEFVPTTLASQNEGE